MKPNLQLAPAPTRQGFVLLAILVFILLLSMITLSLLFRSQGDETSGQATAGSEQAWSAALSGVTEAMRVAATAAPGATDWQDDPALFRARDVYLDGTEQWSFTIFSPAEPDALVDTRYGLSDEASRVNLNHPGDADLAKLPRVTPALASALRQFVGLDPAPASATDQSAPDVGSPMIDPLGFAAAPVTLTNAIIPSHGALATLDELLLLPGMTRAFLHGAPPPPVDLSLSPTLSSSPAGAASTVGMDSASQSAPGLSTKPTPGLDAYLTVFSNDPNRSLTNQHRCNLNDPDDALPAADWPPGFSNYVAAVRTAKIKINHASDVLEATVKVPDNKGVEVEIASEITKENLAQVLDLLTTDTEDAHPGLVNVNTASAAVLATLPDIDSALADAIVSTRAGLSPDRRASLAWLYQEGLVDGGKFKAIAPRLTARSTQFRFKVIGYGLPSGRFRVLEAVIDLAGTDPRLLYLRDITRLGLPLSLKPQNTASPDTTTAAVTGIGARHPFPPHG